MCLENRNACVRCVRGEARVGGECVGPGWGTCMRVGCVQVGMCGEAGRKERRAEGRRGWRSTPPACGTEVKDGRGALAGSFQPAFFFVF